MTDDKKIISKPTVAIVGRTNVGKSTLFNRLTEESKAIVSPIAGTTRAPNYSDCIWRGRVFTVVDTGGLEKRTGDPFETDIREQATKAMNEADAIIFVVDLRIGITPEDRELGKILSKSRNSVILVGNKAEKDTYREKADDGVWKSLGTGECMPISALTGVGVGDLIDKIFEKFDIAGKEPKTVEEELKPLKVVIAGKPNVGKSSLLNALTGTERAIVSEIAHTTREPQDTLIRHNDDLILLIDTAGIRKKTKNQQSLEAAGVKKTLSTFKRADIALFVVDLEQGLESQDKHIAGLLVESGAGIIIVANKWDKIQDKKTNTQNEMAEKILGALPFIRWAPIIFVSAKTGEHVQKIYNLLKNVDAARKTEINYRKLDHFFRQSIKEQRPSRGKGVKHPFIYDIKQVGTKPPTFVASIRGRRESVHPSYLKFLENQLRKNFDFTGTPIFIKSKSIKPSV